MATESRDRELDAVIAEFQSLRQESLYYLGERRQLLSLSIVVCTGILGYAVHIQNGYLASLPMFVAVGCLIMCLAGFNAPQRIGAYVRVFIEPRHPGFNWEHALRECWRGEGVFGRLVFGNRVYVLVGYLAIFTSLGVVSCALTNAYGPGGYAFWASRLGIGILLLSDCLFVYVSLFRIRQVWKHRFEEAYESLVQKGFIDEHQRLSRDTKAVDQKRRDTQ
jgi:hypothetical protein